MNAHELVSSVPPGGPPAKPEEIVAMATERGMPGVGLHIASHIAIGRFAPISVDQCDAILAATAAHPLFATNQTMAFVHRNDTAHGQQHAPAVGDKARPASDRETRILAEGKRTGRAALAQALAQNTDKSPEECLVILGSIPKHASKREVENFALRFAPAAGDK